MMSNGSGQAAGDNDNSVGKNSYPANFEVNGDEVRLALNQRICALSKTTRNVLQMLSEGHSNKFIACELSLSQSTVKVHVTTIMKAFGCWNRTQIVLLALYSSNKLCTQAKRNIPKMAFQRRC